MDHNHNAPRAPRPRRLERKFEKATARSAAGRADEQNRPLGLSDAGALAHTPSPRAHPPSALRAHALSPHAHALSWLACAEIAQRAERVFFKDSSAWAHCAPERWSLPHESDTVSQSDAHDMEDLGQEVG